MDSFNINMDPSTEDLGWECDHTLDDPCFFLALILLSSSGSNMAGGENSENAVQNKIDTFADQNVATTGVFVQFYSYHSHQYCYLL